MSSRKNEAEGGINAFINEQKDGDGEALLTLAQFDTDYDVIHSGVPIGDVPEYELVPRGCTALLDAVGRSLVDTKTRIKAMAKPDRPGLVVFVIVTDGMENSSQEYTKAQIKELVEKQQDKKGWKFIFLGANQDAFAEAGAMGISAVGTASVSQDAYGAVYDTVSSSVGRMRSASFLGDPVTLNFTDEERKKMKKRDA
ncbi:MAG: hypothetical protein KAJ55_00240 [Anaerolineales bacterium]|nr:hypothetical protein [Anaerolineales bacterium]